MEFKLYKSEDKKPDKYEQLRGFDIISYLENKMDEIREIAKKDYERAVEVFSFRNNIGSRGRQLFGERVLAAFNLVINTEDLRHENQEHMDAAYYILLYYVDKLFPDIDISIEEDAVIFHTNTKDNESVGRANLLKYITQEWKELTTAKNIIPYDILTSIHPT